MITRFDPFRDMISMQNALQRRSAFNRMVNEALHESETTDWSLALDVIELDGEYIVKASLPGVKSEDVEITCEKSLLTLRAQRKEESETEQGKVHLRERAYGTFSRSLTLPNTVDADHIHADYADGVLTLHLPKAEELKPRRINISKN